MSANHGGVGSWMRRTGATGDPATRSCSLDVLQFMWPRVGGEGKQLSAAAARVSLLGSVGRRMLEAPWRTRDCRAVFVVEGSAIFE